MELIHIDEFKERRDRHVVLTSENGDVYAIPVELFKRVASGRTNIKELEAYEEVARLVFKEYLKMLEG